MISSPIRTMSVEALFLCMKVVQRQVCHGHSRLQSDGLAGRGTKTKTVDLFFMCITLELMPSCRRKFMETFYCQQSGVLVVPRHVLTVSPTPTI